MAIFDEKKMEQKPIYPTKKTPSYADWALFNMGKELEESITGGGGEITVDQEVIAGSENPVAGGAVKTYVDTEVAGINEVPASVITDSGKILSVDSTGAPAWDSIENFTEQTVIAGNMEPVSGAAVKNYVDAITTGYNFEGEFTIQFIADYDIMVSEIVQLADSYLNKDILVIVEVISDFMQVKNVCYTNSRNILFSVYNSTLDENATLVYSLYTKNKAQTQNNVIVIGQTGTKFNKVPDAGATDYDKVLTIKDVSGYPLPSWEYPSGGNTPTVHTYNTFGDLRADLIAHPCAHIYISNTELMEVVGIYSNSNGLYITIYTNIMQPEFTDLLISPGSTSTTESITGIALKISEIAVYY